MTKPSRIKTQKPSKARNNTGPIQRGFRGFRLRMRFPSLMTLSLPLALLFASVALAHTKLGMDWLVVVLFQQSILWDIASCERRRESPEFLIVRFH